MLRDILSWSNWLWWIILSSNWNTLLSIQFCQAHYSEQFKFFGIELLSFLQPTSTLRFGWFRCFCDINIHYNYGNYIDLDMFCTCFLIALHYQYSSLYHSTYLFKFTWNFEFQIQISFLTSDSDIISNFKGFHVAWHQIN